MSKETAALSSSSSTVDDISQGIDSVDISDEGTSAAAACDMSTSREEDTISEKKCTSCDQKLDNVKTNEIGADNTSGGVESDILLKEEVNSGAVEVSICANCGKEGATNICNKCKQVKYCNAACKKKHKTKHKKACERRVAELHDAQLFKDPPIYEDDCPICFIRLPILSTGVRYNSCCGKRICSGCIHAMNKSEGKNKLCPFCRVPTPTSNKTNVEWIQKRMALNDANAINNIAGYYSDGMLGLSRDYTKALELWKRAAEFGCGEAYYNTGAAYYHGEGVEQDTKKAGYYYELAAMKGFAPARHILGIFEDNAGNTERALKHYMISVEDGCSDSLKEVQDFYSKGYVLKEEYTESLRAYQKYVSEVKSSQRDEAAAFDDGYKYIE